MLFKIERLKLEKVMGINQLTLFLENRQEIQDHRLAQRLNQNRGKKNRGKDSVKITLIEGQATVAIEEVDAIEALQIGIFLKETTEETVKVTESKIMFVVEVDQEIIQLAEMIGTHQPTIVATKIVKERK